jgi:heme/copper-type cytochrome/quinol oxidase subunit 3
MRVPLLNTILLLSSGFSITWCHHAVLEKDYKKVKISLIITISLGVFFLIFQVLEYKEAPFCISDSSFGSTFFIITGFHGFHVTAGIIFLVIILIQFKNLINSFNHIVGFECSVWYWHFVDVV